MSMAEHSADFDNAIVTYREDLDRLGDLGSELLVVGHQLHKRVHPHLHEHPNHLAGERRGGWKDSGVEALADQLQLLGWGHAGHLFRGERRARPECIEMKRSDAV